MKRFYAAIGAMLLFTTASAAEEIRVDFGFFDSAHEQGEKFKQAFPVGRVLDRFQVAGRKVALGSDWTVLHADSVEQTVNISGSPVSGRKLSSGVLVLSSTDAAGKLAALRLVLVSLQNHIVGEFLRKMPKSCVSSSDFVYQDVLWNKDTRMSCIATVQHDADTIAAQSPLYEVALAQWGSSPFGSPDDGAPMLLQTEYYESHGSALISVTQLQPALPDALPAVRRSFSELRQAIQQDFF